PVNLVFQIVLLPLYRYLFFGTYETVGMGDILRSILFVLVVPTVLASAAKLFFTGRRKKYYRREDFSILRSVQYHFPGPCCNGHVCIRKRSFDRQSRYCSTAARSDSVVFPGDIFHEQPGRTFDEIRA